MLKPWQLIKQLEDSYDRTTSYSPVAKTGREIEDHVRLLTSTVVHLINQNEELRRHIDEMSREIRKETFLDAS